MSRDQTQGLAGGADDRRRNVIDPVEQSIERPQGRIDRSRFRLRWPMPAARFPRIRSFVSVPMTLSDGTLYGTFCAAGVTADKQRSKIRRSWKCWPGPRSP